MPRLENETYQNYRKRALDANSPSFCGAKWFNATIWLGSGHTTSCHHPPAHKIDVARLATNPTALHNTEHKKQMRKLMQTGERPPECEYCWKIEDMDGGAVSDRVFKSVIYSDADLAAAARLDWRADVNLKTLEIAFDRACNFACSYCNPNFSTRWAQDVKRDGPYRGLISDGAGHYDSAADEAEPFAADERNPYVDAFWRWWPELRLNLKELRVTGGEPLLTQNLWRLFDYFGDNGGSGDLVFAVNSNLGARDELIDRLVEKSQYVNRFKLFTSGEAYGAQAEYIRDGLEFERWIANLEKILMHGKLESANIMMTINALCLFSITDFLDRTMAIKERYVPGYLSWSVNILRFPSFQSPLTLPLALRTDAAMRIVDWLERHRDRPHVTDFERESLSRLARYLEGVEAPHRGTSPVEALRRDFRSFYAQYDKRRGKSFHSVFPAQLVDWYESLPS